ncbi:MAG TPA: hypothetical protein VIJ14_09705 [Rhabdochlamydiaceae bacterium]
MTEIPPVSGTMTSSQSQQNNFQALAAAAWLLAELAQLAPTSGDMPGMK